MSSVTLQKFKQDRIVVLYNKKDKKRVLSNAKRAIIHLQQLIYDIAVYSEIDTNLVNDLIEVIIFLNDSIIQAAKNKENSVRKRW